MNILQLSSHDLVGKQFNGFVLNQGLLKKGHRASQIVWNKQSKEKFVQLLSNSRYRFLIQSMVHFGEYNLSLQSLFYPFALGLLFNRKFKQADLVHYHLVYPKFFSLLALPVLTQLKPSIWTLHDMWPFTGYCFYSYCCNRWKSGCGLCPYLKLHAVGKSDRSTLMWTIKKVVYKLSKIELVVASQWMAKKVKQSPLLANCRLHLIPFGINLKVFRTTDAQAAKRKMGVFPNSVVLGFRPTPKHNKGIESVKQLLRKLKTKTRICLLSFGDRGYMDEFRGKYQIIDLGWLDKTDNLVTAYNACDVFLMPSAQESFGLMAIEAMACQVPVVVYSGTALEEIVSGPMTDLTIKQGDVQKLLKKVNELVKNPDLRQTLGATGRKLVKQKYNLTRYINDHVELYKQVLSKS